MDSHTQILFDNRDSDDPETRYQAFLAIQALLQKPVDWAYDIWEGLVTDLTHPDNHKRAAAAQFLCSLAKSDPELRILKDFSALMEVTRDKKFVTARHCLQSLWKIGLAGKQQKELVLRGFGERFSNCITEKNATLIRFDIIQGIRKLYDHEPDETIKHQVLELIETEADLKYRKKYFAVWKKV